MTLVSVFHLLVTNWLGVVYLPQPGQCELSPFTCLGSSAVL